MASTYTNDDLNKNFYGNFPAIRFFLEDELFAEGFPPALHGYTSHGRSLATMIPGWRIHSRLDAMSIKSGSTINLNTAFTSVLATREVSPGDFDDAPGDTHTRSYLAFAGDDFQLAGAAELIVTSRLEKTTPGDTFPTIEECEKFDDLLNALGLSGRYSLGGDEVYRYVVDILSMRRREIDSKTYSPGYNFVLFPPNKVTSLGFDGMSVPHFDDNWFLGYGAKSVDVVDYSLDNAAWNLGTLILSIKLERYDVKVGKYSYSMFV